jgi:hypothetical protein
VPETLKVLTLGKLTHAATLEDAARVADVHLRPSPAEESENPESPLNVDCEVDLIITDESRAAEARSALERLGRRVPVLVLCNGSLGEAATALLRSGTADLAHRDDAAAIAAATRGSARNDLPEPRTRQPWMMSNTSATIRPVAAPRIPNSTAAVHDQSASGFAVQRYHSAEQPRPAPAIRTTPSSSTSTNASTAPAMAAVWNRRSVADTGCCSELDITLATESR